MRVAALLLLLVVPAVAKPTPRPENKSLLGVVALEESAKLMVGHVLAGSPAEEAGLRKGDRLDIVGDKKLWRAADLDAALREIAPGKPVNVTYRRDGEKTHVPVKLVARASYRGEFLQARAKGQTGFEAPPWFAYGWSNVADGAEPPTRENTKGKVVVLHAFECSSDGSKNRGFPVHTALEDKFGVDGDVVFVHLQTVYEEEDRNNPRSGRKMAEAKGAKGPVGYDAHVDGHRRSLMLLHYGAEHVPWSVVIDRQGKVVFNAETPDFPDELEKLIEKLR